MDTPSLPTQNYERSSKRKKNDTHSVCVWATAIQKIYRNFWFMWNSFDRFSYFVWCIFARDIWNFVSMYACVCVCFYVGNDVHLTENPSKSESTHENHYIFHTTTLCSWQLFGIDFSSSMPFVAIAAVAPDCRFNHNITIANTPHAATQTAIITTKTLLSRSH